MGWCAMTYKTPSDPAINVDDFTQPIEAVVAQERAATYPVPLKAQSYVDLFIDWLKANPKAAHEIEAVALGIDARGLRVSTKYLIERMRYEGRSKLVAVPYVDQYGVEHDYCINNTITPLMARWLLSLHPEMRIVTHKSMFDDLEKEIAECLGNQKR